MLLAEILQTYYVNTNIISFGGFVEMKFCLISCIGTSFENFQDIKERLDLLQVYIFYISRSTIDCNCCYNYDL